MYTKTGRRILIVMLVAALLAGLSLTAFAAWKACDLDGDGRITVFDAQILAEAKAGLRSLSADQQSAADGYTVQDILDIVLGKQETPVAISCFRPYAGGTKGNLDGYVWDETAQAYVTQSGTNGDSAYAPDGKTVLAGNYTFSAYVTLPTLVTDGGFYLTAYVDQDTYLRYGVEAAADGSLILFSDYQDGGDNNNRMDHQTISAPAFPMNLGVVVCGDHMAMTLDGQLVYDRAVKGVSNSNLVIAGSQQMTAQLQNITAEDGEDAAAGQYATLTEGYQHALVGLLTEMPPEPVYKQNATETYFVNGYSRVTQKPAEKFVRAVHMNYGSTNPVGMEFYKDGNVLDGEAWALSMDLTMKVDGAKTRTGSMTFHVTKDVNNGAGFKFIRDMDGINGIRRFIFRDGTRLQTSGDEVIKDLAVAANWTGKVTFMFYNQTIYLFVQQPDRTDYELISSYPVDWDRCSPQLEVLQYMSVEMANLTMINDADEVAALHTKLAKPENPIDSAKILFLGNSCTFYYDMPNTLARLAKNAGYYVEVNTVARSSARMDMFTSTSDYLYTLSQAEMERMDYDLVFIQGLSSDIDTESNQQRAITGATGLAAAIREAGETPAMFVRPARKLRDMDGDGTLESLVVISDSEGYDALFGGIAQDLGMDAYYVNRAFALAYQKNNDINLWYSDDAHSNARGAYLTACVLFATYFNTSCENVGDDGLPAEDAAFLRSIADTVALDGKESESQDNAIAEVTNGTTTVKVNTVSEMVAAVESTGNTSIRLVKDISSDTNIKLPYSCTLDLNGHTITTNPTSGNGIEISAAGTENKVATIQNGTVISYVVGVRVAAGAVVIDNMQIHNLNGPCVGIYDPAAEYKAVNRITNSTLSSPYACVAFNQKDVDFSATGMTIANTDLISHKNADGKISRIFIKNGNNSKYGMVEFGENVNMYTYADQPTASNLSNNFFNGKVITKAKETVAVTANGVTYEDISCWTSEGEEPLKILMIGNSFCLSFTEELYALAEEAGKDVYIANLYYGGCSVERHWKNIAGQWNTVYNGFYITDTLGYSKHGTILNINDAIDFKDWDIITLQQHFDVQRTLTYDAAVESCTPYVENLYNYLGEKFPDAKLYWHQTWAYEVGYKYPANRDEDPTNDVPDVDVPDVEIQNRQRDIIIEASNWISQTYQVDQIPCGSAWANARANPSIADDPCKDDNCHDGTVEGGQYLNACTWFETLFGESCVGSQWLPSDYTLDAALAAELQKAAHQAVADMYGEDYAQ